MINYLTSLDLIEKESKNIKVENKSIIDALNHISSKNYYSPIDFPPFPQSAMDGYAVSSLENKTSYQVSREIAAGDNANEIILSENEAIRIFTGAMIPSNTVAVVKQEDTQREGNTIVIQKKIQPDENVRPKGEQTKKGDLILKKGTKITPGIIGYFTMLGIFEIEVYQKPSIIILATGNELIQKGEKLVDGKIYESNTYTLLAAFNQYGFQAERKHIPDDLEKTKQAAKEAIEKYDFVIFTGGISVGDYDFVHEVMHDLGVQELFYKVKQKPGKPLFFGKKNDTIIFALPGNPAAVLTSFYVYILHALSNITNNPTLRLPRIKLTILNNYKKSSGLTYFLKGRTNGKSVEILQSQSSAMLSSFVESNCLIILPEGIDEIKEGETVEIIPLY